MHDCCFFGWWILNANNLRMKATVLTHNHMQCFVDLPPFSYEHSLTQWWQTLQQMLHVSKEDSWSLHCAYNGEAQAASSCVAERERRHDVWGFERRKCALEHSIIYVSAASLCPPNPSSSSYREREREREREDSSLLEHSTAHFLERREAENHKPSPPSPSVWGWYTRWLVNAAAVLALAGYLWSSFQNAQQPHRLWRGRWGTQQSG